MPLFPAVKFMDTVIGVDMHAVAPIPGIPIHPYVGPVYLWATPTFPSINVFINGMPACSVGALGYFFHCPQGIPVPPTPTNQPYWKRYLVNIPMVLTLTGLTMLANLAIAGIASLIPKPKSVESFIKDVTGIDTTNRATTWQTIKTMFEAYSKWQTWAKLLMPPLPYPGAQGSVAVGSPNVTVNGGALAFVGPLLGTSCSDIPVVPNAVTLGFSNVLVGVSFADLARAIAVASTQRAIQAAVQKGVDKAKGQDEEPSPEETAEEQNNKCDDAGHPVSQATGAAWSSFIDINALQFILRRTVRSTWHDQDGPFGFGMRHDRQYSLLFEAERAVLVDPDNRRFSFPSREDGKYGGAAFGWTLRQQEDGRFLLRHAGAGVLGFERVSAEAQEAILIGRTRDGKRERYSYDSSGRLDRVRIHTQDAGVEIGFAYDRSNHVTTIVGGEVTLGTYVYDPAGCLTEFRDAMGGKWRYAYDEARRCVRETNPNGYSFHYEYDVAGRCVRSEGDDGLWRVTLGYAPGRTLMTEADNGLWVYAVNEHRTVTEIMDPYGGKRERKPGPDGLVRTEVDSGGRIMRNLFDENGCQVGRLDRWGNRWPTQDEVPNLPNPLAHVIPLTAQTREWGEARGARDLVTGLLRGELSAALDVVIPAAASVDAAERRDLLGRVVERNDRTGAVERYEYDPAGNATAITDADGLTHTQDFASWNLLVARTNAAGETTRYRFTKREKIAAITDPGGAVSKYVYDCKDRLTHVTRHDVLRESYRYDAGDRLVEKLDGEGEPLLTFEIGANGLPSKRVLASGETHNFAYDGFGNITEASTSKASVLMRYAGRRRLSDKRDGRGIEHRWSGSDLVASTWLDRFKIRHETLANGDTLIHPPVGKPHRITVAEDGTALKALGNGTQELSRYDASGRCIGRARWWRGETEPAEWTSYTYSGTGELRTVRDSKAGTTAYRYDSAHRLTGRGGAQGACALGYDAAGNLTSTQAWPELSCIEGNRLDRGGDTKFHYNARNHLAAIEHPDHTVTRFEYDSLDMLVRIENAPGCAEWESEKDGLCRRIAKIVDGARTEFFWDGDRLAAEIAPDQRVRLYIYPDIGALLPLGFIDYPNIEAPPGEGSSYFVFHDQIGLPLLIEDASGRVAWRARSTDPYGAIEVAPGARVTYNLRFPGHYFDPETGLHDNRFRVYSPDLGRYLQSDPAGQSGGVNLYAYAANPLTDVDVLGLSHEGKAGSASGEDPSTAGPGKEEPGEGGAGTMPHTHEDEPPNPFPPRTEEANAACKAARAAVQDELDARGLTTDEGPGAIAAYTHEDGDKSVGLSGTGKAGPGFDKAVQDRLNDGDPNGPYRVRNSSDPGLNEMLDQTEGRSVPPDKCAEPRAASAADDKAASGNGSPVTGFDTVTGPGKTNPYPLPGGEPDQMHPCDNCQGNENAINRYATEGNGRGY